LNTEEKPHLLFSAFAEVPGPGSLGTRVYQLVSVFSDDFDVDGITLKGKDLSHIQRVGTARMLRVPVDGKPFLERLSSFQRALQRQLTGDSYQLVYCADIFSAQIAAAFKESRGYALVVEVNDLPAESYTRGYAIDAPTPALQATWKDIERQALRAADVIIAPSRNAARILSSYVDPRRVQILSRAVDLSVFHPAASEVQENARATVVVVGRRVIAGERHAALAILSALAERLPESRARLVFAGQSALGEDTVQQELVLSGLIGRVESLDIDSPVRLANALMEATVVVVPTKAEVGIEPFAVPHRALEAMACRRATVVTGDAAAFSETFVPSREAVVVDPGRPIDAANAVIRLLDSPAERQAIAIAGHARVSAQADLQKRMAEFAVIITEATGVRMQPRVPESTVRGEWSASGAYSPNGFQGLTDDGGPALVGPSLHSSTASAVAAPSTASVRSSSQVSARVMPSPHAGDVAALAVSAAIPLAKTNLLDDEPNTAANPVSPPLAPRTEASARVEVSKTMLAEQPPSSEAEASVDQWSGDTAIEPDGAFDSSADSSSEPARIVRPTFQALADKDDDDAVVDGRVRGRRPVEALPDRPPPLPRRGPPTGKAPAKAKVPSTGPATIVVTGLESPVTPAQRSDVVKDGDKKVSAESDPFLSTGPSTRPEPARPPTDVRPSLDRTARVNAGPDDRAHARRTRADVPTGQTSTAEPWPGNLGPLARAPLADDVRPTELIQAPAALAIDLPSTSGPGDPWAPDTVFDAVPLFPSGEKKLPSGEKKPPSSEKKPDASDEREPSKPAVVGRSRSGPSAAAPTQAHAMKTKTASSFLVDKVAVDRPSGASSEGADGVIPGAAFPMRATTTPIEGGAPLVAGGALLPTLERATTEPYAAPGTNTNTDTSSAPSPVARGRRARAGDKTAVKGVRTPIVDDENLFSDAEDALGDNADMTMEDASLPSKAAPPLKS
jgi:glycosyltransferase involved in cell wall biosynthesis